MGREGGRPLQAASAGCRSLLGCIVNKAEIGIRSIQSRLENMANNILGHMCAILFLHQSHIHIEGGKVHNLGAELCK